MAERQQMLTKQATTRLLMIQEWQYTAWWAY